VRRSRAVVRVVILDGHVHCGAWKPERVGWPGASLAEVLDALRRSGIDGGILMPTDTGDNDALLAALTPRPPNVYFFPWISPHEPARTMDFLERHADQIDGLKIHPSLERARVDDPIWRPFLEYADRRKLPVVVHCGRWQEMASWRFCLDVAERHPEAAFIVGHLGGDLPTLQQECSEEMARRRLPNAFLGTESIREYYSIRIALDRLGPHRLLFGSDYPLGWPAAYLSVFDGARPTPEEKRLVLGENLLQLLRRRIA
jgi:predicted TIM-barrel fold metal-dependent hydrolase